MSLPTRSTSRLASFGHALRGLAVFARQPNARIHIVAAVLVTALCWWLQIDVLEWLFIILAIVVVLAAEALNTALEYVVDLVSPERHPLARDAKDVAAAAVLICSVGAAIIGVMVLVPYLGTVGD
jgi:diacylglycerol kinase